MKNLIVIFLCLISTLTGFTQKNITLEDIWVKGTFRQKSIKEIRSMKNGDQYCILTPSGIERYDYKTGEKHNKHKAQLEEYELALQEMNYTVAKKALIYIGESIEIVTL